jgi:hypothetical protein
MEASQGSSIDREVKLMSRVFEVLSAAVSDKNPAKPEARGTSDRRKFPMVNEHELESEDRRYFHSKRSWVLALLTAGAALIMAYRSSRANRPFQTGASTKARASTR